MPADNTHLTDEERKQLLNQLDASHQEFFAALDDVSEAQWHWKPGADRWSVGETAEHIVRAEALLFAQVQRALATPANPAWEQETNGKTEFLFRVIPSRQGKAVAPEPIVPREGFTPAQVRERFEMQRREIVTFARETQAALKQHTVLHPFPIFGMLHAHQWLLYVPLHTLRHNRQIAEIKSAPGYPSNQQLRSGAEA